MKYLLILGLLISVSIQSKEFNIFEEILKSCKITAMRTKGIRYIIKNHKEVESRCSALARKLTQEKK